MSLPEEIPTALKSSAVPIDTEHGEYAAWVLPDAVGVVDALWRSKVAVCGIDVYHQMAWGFAAADSCWSCEPMPGETATDFAHRSRDGARQFLDEQVSDQTAEGFYLILFSEQMDAA